MKSGKKQNRKEINMIEVELSIGDHQRKVTGTTINFVSFEYYLLDARMGRCSFIQFIGVENKTPNDLMNNVQKYYDDFDNIFNEFTRASKFRQVYDCPDNKLIDNSK